MIPTRQEFLDNICYTALVFERVNKKLRATYTIDEIKNLVHQIIIHPETSFTKQGKNYYIQHETVELVINSFNYRLITANKKTPTK